MTKRKSSNLVKSHKLICHFIRLYLVVPLPPYLQGLKTEEPMGEMDHSTIPKSSI
jgi:hypothetical protein